MISMQTYKEINSSLPQSLEIRVDLRRLHYNRCQLVLKSTSALNITPTHPNHPQFKNFFTTEASRRVSAR